MYYNDCTLKCLCCYLVLLFYRLYNLMPPYLPYLNLMLKSPYYIHLPKLLLFLKQAFFIAIVR